MKRLTVCGFVLLFCVVVAFSLRAMRHHAVAPVNAPVTAERADNVSLAPTNSAANIPPRISAKHLHPAILSAETAKRAATAPERKKAMQAYMSLPLDFEANQGQAPKEVAFVAHGPGYALGLSPGAAKLSLQRPETGTKQSFRAVDLPSSLQDRAVSSLIELRLRGANSEARTTGIGQGPGQSNYFIGNKPGNWRRNIPHFNRVKMAGVYPGVDLVFYGNPRELEYDFLVSPGADPGKIQWEVVGAERISADREGNVVVHTAAGGISLHRPVSYQEIDGVRKPVASRFEITGRRLKFAMGSYDHTKELVIDPVLVFSLALGSTDGFVGTSVNTVELDASGNFYLGGYTGGTDFPSTIGPFDKNPLDPSVVQSTVGFVAKMDPTASTLIYSDFVGGSGISSVWYLAPDATGNVFVTGLTRSPDYPLVNNIGKTTAPAACTLSKTPAFICPDGVVFKLSPDGSQLLFSSMIGGSQATFAIILQVNPVSGEVIVMGATNSSDLLPAPTTLQKTFSGTVCSSSTSPCFETFVLGLDPTTGAVRYQTYIGGAKNTISLGLQTDNAGALYLLGSSAVPLSSTLGPVTNNYPPAGGATAAGVDTFIMKLTVSPTNALSVGYLTFIRGESDDTGSSFIVDGTGNVYFIGSTGSQHLPVTSGVFQPTNKDVNGSACPWKSIAANFFPANSCGTAFVGKLTPTGTLSFLTYLGGSGPDLGTAIAQDSDGNLWLGGTTSSSDFPFSPDAYSPTGTGTIISNVPYLAEMSNDGKTLPFASVIAASFGFVLNITSDNSDNLFVTGYSTAVPTTPGVYPANPNVFQPAFVQKWNAVGKPPALQLSTKNVSFPDTPIGGVSAPQAITLQNTGAGPMELSISTLQSTFQLLPSADFPVTSNCASTLAASGSCTITASFAPASPSPECLAAPGCPSTTRGAVITVQNNAPGGTQTISLGGNTGSGANISVAPNPVVFPAQAAGTNSANTDVFVSNNGDLALSISNIAIGGTNAADFKFSLVSGGGPACTTPLPTGGSSCQLEVSFTPAANATGTRTANLVLTDGGIGSPQSILLSGVVAGTGSLNVSPSSITLNPTAAGNGTTGSFNLSNPGSAQVQVTAINITGTNAAEFTVGTGSCPGGTPFNVPAGGACNLGVTFTSPSNARGLQSASVSFSGPQITASPTVALSVNVLNNTDPAIKYFTVPSPFDFGSLEVGQSTVLQTHFLDISNAAPIPCAGGAPTCGGPLNISSMNAGMADYIVSLNGSGGTCTLPPVTIASGTSCIYQVVFTPSAGGARNSTLNIVSNDPQGTVAIPLTGIGLTLPIISATPSILNFGSSQSGVASPPLTVTLQNSGRGPVGSSSVAASANFAVLANNCNQSVPAGGSCTITVTFTPPGAGSFSGTLTITNNATFGGQQSVALTGTGGTGASLLISPATLTFPNQPTNTTSLTQTVTLTSTGNAAVTFPTGAFRATNQFQIASNTCGASLAPGASCAIAVTYTAASPDPQGGTILIMDNAKGSPQPIFLSGTGQLNGNHTSNTTLLSSANPVAAGQPVTFTAAVSASFAGTLSGTVLFLDGSTTIGSALVDGTAHANFSTSSLSGGSHSITANYSGNNLYFPSTSSAISQVVTGGTAPATTAIALTSSLNPSTAGASVTFTASVSSTTAGTITGSVTFKDGATTLGSGTVNAGTATFATSALTQGSHSITAVYGGDSNFATSTSAALSQTVNAGTLSATATTLTSSPNPSNSGQSVTLTATVTSTTGGTITGSVTFLDGTTSLGVGTVSGGKATVSATTLSGGSHSLTAAYGGDTNYAASTSSAVTQTVNIAADFSVALAPSALTLKAGQSGTLLLNATPINGGTFTLNLSCGAPPTKTTCAFSPASITLDGKDVASSMLTVATTANSAGLPLPESPRNPGSPLIWSEFAAAFAVLLAMAWRTSSRLQRRVLLASAVLLLGIGLNACNGGGGGTANTGTPAGTYPVILTVAPASGGTTHTATATITVTQ